MVHSKVTGTKLYCSLYIKIYNQNSDCKIRISTIMGNVIFCIYKFTINILDALNTFTNILLTICLFCLTLPLLSIHVGNCSGVSLLDVLPLSSGYSPLLVLH